MRRKSGIHTHKKDHEHQHEEDHQIGYLPEQGLHGMEGNKAGLPLDQVDYQWSDEACKNLEKMRQKSHALLVFRRNWSGGQSFLIAHGTIFTRDETVFCRVSIHL